MHRYFNCKLSFQRYELTVCIVIVLLCICFSCLHTEAFGNGNRASADKRISLEEALSIALEKNPQLQSARDQVDVALGSLRQSKLYPNPVLDLIAEEIPTNEIGLDQDHNIVNITQPVITAGKRKLGIKAGKQAQERDEFERDAILLTVIADTKKAFYGVIANQESLSIAQETEKIAKGIYESEKARFEAGEVPVTNSLRAEIELSRAKNLVFNAESNLQNSMKGLLAVMGIPEESLAGATGKLFMRPVELSLTDLEMKMRNNQPRLKASKKNIEIAETQLTLEKRQVIPNINVSAGYKRLSREEMDTVQVGIEIPMPLFNRNQGNIQKGRAISRKTKSENLSVYNDLLFQLKKDFNTYQAERKRILEYNNKILPKTEESLSLILEGYKEGEFGYIDLLDAQRTWAETRILYIESLKNLHLLIADIERLAVTKIGKH